MGTITQIFQITGGLSNSWLKSMRAGEESARRLERQTQKTGQSVDRMGDRSQRTSGMISGLTSSLGGARLAMLGAATAGGALAAALLGVLKSAESTINELFKFQRAIPGANLGDLAQIRDSFAALGIPTRQAVTLLNIIPDALERIGAGTSTLSPQLQRLAAAAGESSENAARFLDALALYRDELIATEGPARAQRILYDGVGESIDSLAGSIQFVRNQNTTFLEQLRATPRSVSNTGAELQNATVAVNSLGTAMERLRNSFLSGIEPIASGIVTISDWLAKNEEVASFIKVAAIPTIGLLTFGIVSLGLKAVAAGIAATAAWAPFIVPLVAIGAAVGGIYLAIKNWPAIWDSIKRAVRPVVDFFKSIVRYIKEIIRLGREFYESPAFYLVPGVGQAKLAADVAGGIGSGIRAVTSAASSTYNSSSTSYAQTNRSVQINIEARTDSEQELGRTIADNVLAAEDRAI